MDNSFFYWLLVPFILQATLMLVDEFYYHHKRGLPLWERLGHPLDSMSVLACFMFLRSMPYTEENLRLFIILASFSCIFVTKDEWIHSKICPPGEMWLHGLLFVLHPLLLTSGAYIWSLQGSAAITLQNVLNYQVPLITAFTIYQITYWSFPWKKLKQSITLSMTL